MSTAKSLTKGFLIIVFLSVVFNLLLSLGLIFFTGTFRRMKAEIYEDFAAQIVKKGEALSQGMEGYMLGAVITANNIDQRIKLLAGRNGVLPSELIQSGDMAMSVMNIALSSLSVGSGVNEIAGSFFILCNTPVSAPHDGFYLKLFRTEGDRVTYRYERGPRLLADRAQVDVAPEWRPRWGLGGAGDDMDFYKRMYGLVHNHNITMRDDGYWSPPRDLLDDGVRRVAYSVPLLDEARRPYAILGFEIDVAHIEKALRLTDGEKYEISYCLSGGPLQDSAPSWLIAEGPPGGERGPGKYTSMSSELQMYPSMSLYRGEGWTLTGSAEQRAVLDSYYSALRRVILSMLVSLLLAAVLVFIIAKSYLDRITSLGRQFNIDVTKDSLHLTKTNIAEIDYLATALEDLHKSAQDSAMRVAAIFEMLKMPIGFYELRTKGAPRVLVTPSLRSMLSLRADEGDNTMYMEPARWNEAYTLLKSHPYEREENIYCWQPEDTADTRFIRVEEISGEDSTIGVLTDVTEHIHKSMELEYQASFDPLTRLYNRRVFKQKVAARIRQEPDKVGAMLFGDLDGLKRINDVYGHAMGDMLIQTAGAMVGTLQSIGGVVSRLSGDEFAAYIHGYDSREEVLEILCGHMEEYFCYSFELSDGVRMPVSMSRGIATFPDDSDDFSTLLSFADYTMYKAKFSQKGSVRVFDRDEYLEDAVLREKNDALGRLIEEHEMDYAYQPIRGAVHRELFGYSVYMRPQAEELTNPRSVLEIALVSGRTSEVERMIFSDVLRRIQEDPGLSRLVVCIRSMKGYLFDEREVAALARDYKDAFRRLMVLIPTDAAMDEEVTERKVQMFRAQGSGIALDCAGDNLDGLRSLLRLEPDMVKIDIEQVKEALARQEEAHRLEAILRDCRARGILLLAAKIETASDCEIACRLGFDMLQGYFVGSPGEYLLPA